MGGLEPQVCFFYLLFVIIILMSILLTTTIMRCYTSYDDGHPTLTCPTGRKKARTTPTPPFVTSTTTIVPNYDKRARDVDASRAHRYNFIFLVCFVFPIVLIFFFAKLETLRGPNDGIKAQDDPTPNFAMSTASTTTVVPNDDKRARDADAFQAHWYVFLVCYIFFLFFIASPNRIYVKTSRQQGSLGVSGRFRHLA